MGALRVAAPSLSRSQPRALGRPRRGRGRYGNAGPQQSHSAVPATSCRDCALAGPRVQTGAQPLASGEGRFPACGGQVPAGAPLWCPQAGGRAGETSYPRSVGHDGRLLLFPPPFPSRLGFPRSNATPETGRRGLKAAQPGCNNQAPTLEGKTNITPVPSPAGAFSPPLGI